jgi:hypothetical protein
LVKKRLNPLSPTTYLSRPEKSTLNISPTQIGNKNATPPAVHTKGIYFVSNIFVVA